MDDGAGKLATCVCSSGFEGLTYGRKYLVKQVAPSRVCVVRDGGKSRWFPPYCFDLSAPDVPVVAAINIDDEPPWDTPVEVSLTFSDGQRRWLIFATPEMLAKCGDFIGETGVRIHYAHHLIVVSHVSADIIRQAVGLIESKGELIAHSRSLD